MNSIIELKHVDGRVISGTRKHVRAISGLNPSELCSITKCKSQQSRGWSLPATVVTPFRLSGGKPCRTFGRIVHPVFGIFCGSGSEFADLYSGKSPRLYAIQQFWALIHGHRKVSFGWRLVNDTIESESNS